MRRAFFICIAMLSSLQAAAADKLFAAPDTSSAAATSGGASLGKTTLALAVVLGFVFFAAWVLKQTRKLQAGKGNAAIEVVSQVALGAKERAVLLKVGDVQVLVGVTPNQINPLHVMPASAVPTTDTPTETAPQTLSFQAVLKRSLGLSK